MRRVAAPRWSKSRFAHTGARRHNDEIRGLQPGGQFVQAGITGSDAGYNVFGVGQLGKVVENLFQQFLGGRKIFAGRALRNGKNGLFRFVKQFPYLARGVITVGYDAGAGVDEAALQRFVAHNGGIVFRIGAGNHGLGKLAQIDGAARFFKRALAFELLGGGNKVDGCGFAIKLKKSFENCGVGREVKVFVRQLIHNGVHAAEVTADGPKVDVAQRWRKSAIAHREFPSLEIC